MKPTLFVAVLALIMASAAPTTANAPTTFTVAEGETLILSGTVTAETITVHGTILAVGDLSLTADTITLTDTARVHGADGLPGASVVADSATAGDGGAGGSLTLSARVLTIADGAHVQSGSGGAGGNAIGTSLAVGGLGGDGGGIHLHAQSTSIDAVLLPGAGGDGGHAIAQVGPAHGGAGGDSGTVYLDGALFLQDIPDVLAPQSSDSKLPLETLPGIHFQPPPKCQQGECPLDDLLRCEECPPLVCPPNKPAECVPPLECEGAQCLPPIECNEEPQIECVPSPLACWEWYQPATGCVDDIAGPVANLLLNECGSVSDQGGLLPIAGGSTPSGSYYEYYIFPHKDENSDTQSEDSAPLYDVYMSWSIEANTLNNGANKYAIGTVIEGTSHQDYPIKATWTENIGNCRKVGSIYSSDFTYKVQAGTWGTSTTTEYTFSLSISLSGGVSFTWYKPTGEYEATVGLGATFTFADSTTFDSEVIFTTSGSS